MRAFLLLMAPKTIVTEKPVVLEGYQAVMKPSKFGYSLATVFTDDLIEQLEADRTEVLKWCESKLKNPKRATLKPEPWEEVSDGKYKVSIADCVCAYDWGDYIHSTTSIAMKSPS